MNTSTACLHLGKPVYQSFNTSSSLPDEYRLTYSLTSVKKVTKDSARKVSKWIVEMAKIYETDAVELEKIKNPINNATHKVPVFSSKCIAAKPSRPSSEE